MSWTLGIETNDDLVASELGIDLKEQVMDLDIGEVRVDFAGLPFHEERTDSIEVDLSKCHESLVVAGLWSLFNLRVNARVIADIEPCRESAI